MEYGFWSLGGASRLWSNLQLYRNAANLPGDTSPLLSISGYPLNSFHPCVDLEIFQSIELARKFSNNIINGNEANTPCNIGNTKRQGNECNIEKGMESDNENHNEGISVLEDESIGQMGNDGLGDESDTASTTSSTHHFANNNINIKNIPHLLSHPLSLFHGLDKSDTNVTPLLNGWVVNAYTAMLSRLSTATAFLEATEVPAIPSDNDDSESDNNSSCTEKTRDNSPISGIYNGEYPCNTCDVTCSTKSSLRKHILQYHRISSNSPADKVNNTNSYKCPSKDCTYMSNNKDEIEVHVTDNHIGRPGNSGKKRTMALQRVRYEREEYRCTMCNYACTIEKAFQRHLKAHARGATAPEIRLSCAVCGADRTSEVDLSRHMKRHRDDRYFCCDICVFRTVQLKKLIQHRRMHTGEKPHLCPHCAYRSARRDNLRSHVRRVHKKENLYCDTFNPRGMIISSTSPSVADSHESTIINDEKIDFTKKISTITDDWDAPV